MNFGYVVNMTVRGLAISINSVHREACCWERSEQ
jgi:hypothetical protein